MTDVDGYEAIKARHTGANGRGGRGTSVEPLQLVHFRDMRARLNGRPLVKGMLDCQQTSLFVGESGSGKTFLAIDLALHVAAGQPWFDRKVTAGPVIYVAAEAGRSIANRVTAWRDQHQPDIPIPFGAIVSPVDLCHPEAGDVDRLIAAIREAGLDGPVLMVIDTVSRVLAGGNENGPDDMGALVRSLDRLRDELRCHVCAVHHLGKDATRGGRGHSLLRCAVDTEITVARNGDAGIATATVTKQRDGIAGAAVTFRLRPVELGRDADGDPVTSCIVDPAEGTMAAKGEQGRKRLTDVARIALDTLRNALAQDGSIPPASNHIPANIPTVEIETWRRFYYSGIATDGQSADARKHAFQRAREKLQAAGAIGVHNDLCWVVSNP